MAIAFDASATGIATDVSSLTFSMTVASGSDRALLVSFGYYNRSRSATGVTFNGDALTKLRRYDNGSAAATSEIWYLAAPDVGTYNVVITLDAATGSGVEFVGTALSFTGVDQTTPLEADNGGTVVTGAHTAHSGSVTTVTANAWVVDHLLYVFCLDASTSVGSQTERSHIYGTNVGMDISTRGPIATPNPESAGWTFTNPGAATNQIVYAVKPAAAAYTLTASGGSFTLTGTAASLEFGRSLAAASGTFALTGTAANLEYGRTLGAGSGSYTLTGTAANLEFGRYLFGGSGTFTVTGTAANLEYNRLLSAASGSFAVTGTAATLTYGTVGGYTLAANGGTFAVTGTAATLTVARRLSAASGTYAVTGTAASLECGRLVSAGYGAFALTGTAATLIYGQPGSYTLAANGATFTVTGTAAALTCGRRITAGAGAYALTGTDATLGYGRRLGVESGAFIASGTDANLEFGRRLSAEAGAFAATGTDATLIYGTVGGYTLAASGGTFALTGGDASLRDSGGTSTAFYISYRSGWRHTTAGRSGQRYGVIARSKPLTS